jgi:hypothetical protein
MEEFFFMIIYNNAHPSCQLVHQQLLVSKSPTWYHQGINSAMTHVPNYNAKVRRNPSQNEWLCHTLDIGHMFRPNLA